MLGTRQMCITWGVIDYYIHVNAPPKRARISTFFSTQVVVLQPPTKTITSKYFLF